MDVQTISQFISTIGFPIVAAGAMFWLNYKTVPTLNQIAELLREVEELLKEVEKRDYD